MPVCKKKRRIHDVGEGSEGGEVLLLSRRGKLERAKRG